MLLTTAGPEVIRGWVHQPNGRGTLDILQSCLLTVFLCSWTVLCLNIPAPGKHRWSFLQYKFRWQLFAIFFPEVAAGLAAEQWESANQSVEDFSARGFKGWTMRHAFFADMGGFLLEAPDFPPFPVNAQHLIWLIDQKYMSYPDVDENAIRDKNKADGFSRAITLIQVAWFCIQCIGRAIQHIALSTFELSTLAFIICTLNILFFWNHKPLDVETPIVLQVDTRIADIILRAGASAAKPYNRTPLDFLDPPVSRTSLIAPFWFGVGVFIKSAREPSVRPARTFGNNVTRPYRGITVKELIYGVCFELSYFGIHLVGWNFVFPTKTEQRLWRGASLTFIALIVIYLIAVAVGTLAAGWVARRVFKKEARTILDVAPMLPRWAQVVIHLPILAAYVIARAYIVLEGLISLRALPATAYASVNWSNFVPHY